MSTLSTQISLNEYLHTTYRPDVEYLDGMLKEKPMPTRLHAVVQLFLSHWFAMHMDEWNIIPLPEVRTRVSPTNFRLPDLAIVSKGGRPSKNQEEPPLIAIEIISPDDRFSDLRARARDLHGMGVPHIWHIDPEPRETFVWGGAKNGAWTLTPSLRVEDSPIHLDLAWLWAKIDACMPPESN